MVEQKNKETLYVGTYTNNSSEGIYTFSFNSDTGELYEQTLAASMTNPSFLAIAPNKKTLYAVSEVDDYHGHSGALTTFRIQDSLLQEVDSKSTYGANPCFVGVSDNSAYVAVANYSGGNVAIYKTKNNGNLDASPQVIDHKVLDTSKTAHAHMASFFHGELVVSDLGLDKIKKYNQVNGEFTPSLQSELVVVQGSGPRHFTTSDNGKYLYVINELNSTITVFKKDADTFFELETYATLAADFEGESFCADIHLSPDGKFLYGSNRGENTIVIFKIEASNGKLELIGREPVKGDWPRNFSMDPSGNFLLVANQRSNNIVVFKRNSTTGALNYLSQVELSSPVCLVFY
jgi:6-phosphogluconolactonase